MKAKQGPALRRRALSLLGTVLIGAALTACGAAAAPSVDGREFLSTSVAPRQLVPGTRVRISFSDGSLSASAGCNIIGGSYTITNGQLVVDALAMTEMGCDGRRHDQDAWLSTFLGSRPQVTIDGDNLVLTGGGTTLTLLDREVAEPAQPLAGPTWTLVSIISGDAVSSVPQGVVATLRFAEDGSVEVRPGCNSGGGRYAVEGALIRFSDIVHTRMACDGAAGQIETQVLAVLGADALTFSIDGGSLTLTAGQLGLQFAAAAPA